MALTNAQQDQKIAALETAMVTVKADVAALKKQQPPPPPPIDTTADVGSDLKVTITPPPPGLAVQFTVTGLDADADAVVTFADSAGRRLGANAANNGTFSATLTGFAWGPVNATIVATDAAGNNATGAPASATLTAATAPPPPPPAGTGVAQTFVGPFDTATQTIALGGAYKTWEDRFVQWANYHWGRLGARWDGEGGAAYDLAKCYYIWAERDSANAATYLSRAHAMVVDYRDKVLYSGTAPQMPSEPWWQLMGVALHSKHTNDPKSLAAIGDQADWAHYKVVDDRYTIRTTGSYNVNRMQAAWLHCLLAALHTNAVSNGTYGGVPGGRNWRQAHDQLITDIIATQNAAGHWRFVGPEGQIWVYPYQMGMVMDALISSWYLVNQDPRIPAAIKKCVDWLWNSCRDPGNGSFYYVGENNPLDNELRVPPGSDSLVLMPANAFGFIYHYTGDATYKTRVDTMFANAMRGDGQGQPNGAYLVGYKQFQQSYTHSYRVPRLLQLTPLNRTI